MHNSPSRGVRAFAVASPAVDYYLFGMSLSICVGFLLRQQGGLDAQ